MAKWHTSPMGGMLYGFHQNGEGWRSASIAGIGFCSLHTRYSSACHTEFRIYMYVVGVFLTANTSDHPLQKEVYRVAEFRKTMMLCHEHTQGQNITKDMEKMPTYYSQI